MHNGSITVQRDLEHLKLLSIFHYVLGGMTALFSCMPIIHLLIGLAIVTNQLRPVDPEAQAIGWIFISLAIFFILTGWTFAIGLMFAGRFLSQKKHYTYCFIIAIISCLFMPFGTILGVFTIVVLVRDSVNTLFKQRYR